MLFPGSSFYKAVDIAITFPIWSSALVGTLGLMQDDGNSLLTRIGQLLVPLFYESTIHFADSGILTVDPTFFSDSFEPDRSWDDSGTTISGI